MQASLMINGKSSIDQSGFFGVRKLLLAQIR